MGTRPKGKDDDAPPGKRSSMGEGSFLLNGVTPPTPRPQPPSPPPASSSSMPIPLPPVTAPQGLALCPGVANTADELALEAELKRAWTRLSQPGAPASGGGGSGGGDSGGKRGLLAVAVGARDAFAMNILVPWALRSPAVDVVLLVYDNSSWTAATHHGGDGDGDGTRPPRRGGASPAPLPRPIPARARRYVSGGGGGGGPRVTQSKTSVPTQLPPAQPEAWVTHPRVSIRYNHDLPLGTRTKYSMAASKLLPLPPVYSHLFLWDGDIIPRFTQDERPRRGTVHVPEGDPEWEVEDALYFLQNFPQIAVAQGVSEMGCHNHCFLASAPPALAVGFTVEMMMPIYAAAAWECVGRRVSPARPEGWGLDEPGHQCWCDADPRQGTQVLLPFAPVWHMDTRTRTRDATFGGGHAEVAAIQREMAAEAAGAACLAAVDAHKTTAEYRRIRYCPAHPTHT